MSASSSISTQLFQHPVFYSRRLLPQNLQHLPTAAAPPPSNSHDPSDPYGASNGFDANVVMVLSVLLCALICSLGLNSIIKCALRCSSLVASETSGNPSARLANTGIKKKALKTFPTVNYSAELKLDNKCAICLSEFASGEHLRLLPKCNHGFHVRCIDKWLNSHSSCPTCRNCLLQTCQKIVGCSKATTSQPPPQPAAETILHIAPLQPEGLIRDYR